MTDLTKRLLSVSTVLAKGMLSSPDIVHPHLVEPMSNEKIVERSVRIAELLIGEVSKRTENV